MKKIQVHWHENGQTGVINYLTALNGECRGDGDRNKLKELAQKYAGQWAAVYPETKFTVEEVS